VGKVTNFSVTIIASDDTVILEKKVNYLPLKEELIIAQSIEFFNDPEPCMIHRTAVMKKIFVEFLEYFEELFSQSNASEIQIELPERLQQKLDIKKEIKHVIVRRG